MSTIKPKYTCDMHGWLHRMHQITGSMATHWSTVTKELVQTWAVELKAIAKEMEDDEGTTRSKR